MSYLTIFHAHGKEQAYYENYYEMHSCYLKHFTIIKVKNREVVHFLEDVVNVHS